jgi:MFS family permease
MASRGTSRSVRALPPGIWALGLVSLFMDTSSELVHSLLPVFMTSVLGAGMLTVGLVEGVAEAAASVMKVISGVVSDRWRKRKPLVVLGYGLAAVTKPLFPMASSVTWVFAARFIDRIGKGIRGAPRDALVADITPPELRGAAYGLRQALDSVGAFVGPALAMLLMMWLANDIKAVLWAAVVPAALAVAVLVAWVREPEPSEHQTSAAHSVTVSGIRELPRRYWLVVGIGSVFTLARFSEAFLVLRAQDVGLAMAYIPAVMIVMNVVYAVAAYPAGRAADRLPGRSLLVVGLATLVVADLILATAHRPSTVFLGAACWGLHMALTQGVLSKLVAEDVPGRLRGTAFGIFNLASGGAVLLASVTAGALWSRVGPSATFLAGATFAMVATLALLAYQPARPQA